MNHAFMRKTTVSLAMLLVVAACKPESTAKVVNSPAAAELPASRNLPRSTSGLSPVSVTEDNWQSELAWVDDSAKIDGRTSISTARSFEEAQWLQRHGFLTRSKIEQFNRLGFQEVSRLARAGNSDAILFLSEQMIKDGRGDLAKSALNKLIEKEASIPALHLRARYKTSKVTEVPSELPTDSWQWRDAAFESSESKIDVASDYFAAYLLGDYRGAQIATKMFAYDKDGLPPVVYTNAARMVAGMAQGGHSIRLDPRPMPDDARGANDF